MYNLKWDSAKTVNPHLRHLYLQNRVRRLWKLHKRQQNKIRWLLFNLKR